ncbi:MAG TPA: hypothetical protein VMG63_02165 [Terriglobia bacterium]|jgi:hypothetical protein|nr:hypothetical protein [Terriglobia bacterium]
MRATMISAPGNELEQVRCRFELWRKTRKRCSPIPQVLWTSAAKLVRQHGLYRTARTLRLNYYSLKKRLSTIEDLPCRSPQKVPTFIELLPAESSGSCACAIEMENARGEKMKIHLPGLGSPELAVLTQSFWRTRS